MPIRITLDEVLAAKHMKAKHVAQLMGISETHLSLFRSGKVRGVRFSTLSQLCCVLQCQPGDLIAYDFVESEATASGEKTQSEGSSGPRLGRPTSDKLDVGK